MSVTIQTKGGTAARWTLVNPVLAPREQGLEKDTGLVKYGDGVRTWNQLPYVSNVLGNLPAISDLAVSLSEPAAPTSGFLRLFSKSIGGRSMLAQKGAGGIATALQPHLGRNYVQVINTNGSTSVNSYGCTAAASSGGPAWQPNGTLGIGTIVATAATANAGAYVQASANAFYRSATLESAGGFTFSARAAFPDVTYDATVSATGSRAFVGLTAATTTAITSADTLLLATVGFRRVNVFGGVTDTNWQIHAANGTAQSKTDTGMSFNGGDEYLFELFSPPGATAVSWRIENVTAGTSATGKVTDTLPNHLATMKHSISLTTVNAVARRIWLQTMYCECDR